MKIGIGPLWIEAEPIKKWRERRQAKKAAKQNPPPGIPEASDEFWDWTEQERPKMQINLGTRTSTNGLATGTVASAFGIKLYEMLVGLVPWPAIGDLLMTTEATAFFAVALPIWIVSRLTKTPAAPKAL